MSYVQSAKLRGTLDPTLPHITIRISFTTGILFHDFLTEYASYCRAYKIFNQDNTNNLTFVQHQVTDPPGTIPPASEASDEGWFSLIVITPNGVTGRGYAEFELVSRKDAEIGQ